MNKFIEDNKKALIIFSLLFIALGISSIYISNVNSKERMGKMNEFQWHLLHSTEANPDSLQRQIDSLNKIIF